MNIKSLLLGSAAALVAATGAQAADVIVAPEPEAVEYVRVCDAYGAGYFYIPGTETCLRIGGYVRYDIKGGDHAYSSKQTVGFETKDDKRIPVKGDVYGASRGGWEKYARFALVTQTASETEYGTLRTFTETRMNWTGKASDKDFSNREKNYGSDSRDTNLEYAWIDLGGFRVGLAKTMYKEWTGYLGNVMQDDVISEGNFTRTGQIAYTFAGGNGFSAVVAVEQGAGDYVISNYTPHVVGGIKYEQGWGSLAAVAAYDSVIKGWSGKVRGDVNVTDQFSVWVMGGFAGKSTEDQAYGSFGGKWAVWGGAAYKATDKATFNLQAATEDWGKTSVTANVAYQLVPGFTITPEVTWSRVKNNSHYNRDYFNANGVAKVGSKDAVQGMLRFQRSF